MRVALQIDGSPAKLPFNSLNKFALCVVENYENNSANTVLIKGAPEKVWSFCSKIFIKGQVLKIDKGFEA